MTMTMEVSDDSVVACCDDDNETVDGSEGSVVMQRQSIEQVWSCCCYAELLVLMTKDADLMSTRIE